MVCQASLMVCQASLLFRKTDFIRYRREQIQVRIERYFNYIIWEKLNSFVANDSIISFVFSFIVCFRWEKSLYNVTVKILLSFQQAISDCIVQNHTLTLYKPRSVRHLFLLKNKMKACSILPVFSAFFTDKNSLSYFFSCVIR